MAQFQNPEDSQTPLYSLAETRRRGLDPSKVRSCAVPEDGKVLGCRQWDKCVTRHFGSPKYAGLSDLHRGPKRAEPGVGGDGPFNLTYYKKDLASRTEAMKCTACFIFIGNEDAEMLQAHITGNEVRVLGGEGSKYIDRYLVPVDPNNNKTQNLQMREEVVERIVPPFEQVPHETPTHEYAAQMEGILKAAALRQAMAGVDPALMAAPAPATPEGATASAEPVGKKRGT